MSSFSWATKTLSSTSDPKALEALIYRIKAVPGVARITSTIVLSTALEGRPLMPEEPKAR